MTSASIPSLVTQPAAPAPLPRYTELDSVRGLAAFFVLIHHFRMMWGTGHSFTGWRRALNAAALLVNGHALVMLFFVLSGFVLSVPYLRGKGQSYPVFLLRRILRIYGPYLGALAIAAAADAIWNAPTHHHGIWADFTWTAPLTRKLIFQHILFVGEYPWPQINTVIWSLVMEMRVSIIFPLLFAAVLWLRPALSLLFAAALIVVPFLLPLNGAWYTTLWTLQIIAVFITGIVLAIHIDAVSAWCRRLSPFARLLFTLTSFGLFIFADRIGDSLHMIFHIDVLLITISSASLIILALNVPAFSTVLHSRIPRFLGRISYSLYLIHGTVLFALTFFLHGRLSALIQFPIFIAISLLLATLFCLAIEEPFLRLNRRVGKASFAQSSQPLRSARTKLALCLTATLCLTMTLGCNSTPTHTKTTTPTPTSTRPTTPPPPFTLFHQANSTFTLVTTPTATDDQIAAILWQLRDAAHTHTFDQLHIPQSVVDARDPMVWFHLYRGSKCAPEKYADGKLPCGDSYHAAADYTFGGGPHHDWDSGELFPPPNAPPTAHETQLWPPGSPYTPPR